MFNNETQDTIYEPNKTFCIWSAEHGKKVKVVIKGRLLLQKSKKTGIIKLDLQLVSLEDIKKDMPLFTTMLSLGFCYKSLKAYEKYKIKENKKIIKYKTCNVKDIL